MKKIYSLALIILTLFSCVLFSACGDKYKNLKIEIFSTDGYVVEEFEHTIDQSNKGNTIRLNIEFSGIDKEDVGQIVVYSIPNEIVTVVGYSYNETKAYVDLIPNMASKDNAKLIVSHLASGKKKEIPLNIEQKSNNLNIVNSQYVIAIPDSGTVDRIVDFGSVLNLLPYGSTDKVWFKVLKNDRNIQLVKDEELALIEGYDHCYSGFNVTSGIQDGTVVEIYPVTYMEGYEDEDQDKYRNKKIIVHFKHILNSDNVSLAEKEGVDFDNIRLIANDTTLNSMTLGLNFTGVDFSDVVDMYEIVATSEDDRFVSAFVDANNNIVVTAHAFTNDLIGVEIRLKPINYVGELYPVVLKLSVKGELKSDKIEVKKNSKLISTDEMVDIFNYYSEGNALGSLFSFNAISVLGVADESLTQMRIVIDASILSEENTSETPFGLNSMLYSLEFYISDKKQNINDYLHFKYESGTMVSDPITKDSRVYIKYVNGNGTVESPDFGIAIETINNSGLKHWETLTSTKVNILFNRIEGVKSMKLDVGKYVTGFATYYGQSAGLEDVEYVYLNRKESLDWLYFIDVINRKVIGVDDKAIPTTSLKVVIKAENDAENQLKIHNGFAKKEDVVGGGVSEIDFVYDYFSTEDVISLVYDETTAIGRYDIIFTQEDVVKDIIICYVYEEFDALTSDMVSVETNAKAFKNEEYTTEFKSDYIVAKGQELNISIDLPKNIIDSNILKEYVLDFEIGDEHGSVDAALKKDYFEVVKDRVTDNNAILTYKKGTFIDDKPQYVQLTVKVLTKKYDNIITLSADPMEFVLPDCITFYIYEEIESQNISINHTSMKMYTKEFLGTYYSSLSDAKLEIKMQDSSLWNYVTGDELVVWNIDGINISYNEDSDGDGYNDFYSQDGVVISDGLGTAVCDFKFGMSGQNASYTRIVKAYIKQFKQIFEFQCVFNVEKPILTERLEILSDVKIDETTQKPYINLEIGDDYQAVARNISNDGQVTNPEIIIQIINETGSVSNTSDYFDVDQDNSYFKVKKIDGSHTFRLVVFAKDVVNTLINSEKYYADPSTFILNIIGATDADKYLNAYCVVDIKLSDGSEETPYLIENMKDFYRIDDEGHRDSYYLLMTGISLSDSRETIKNFNGTIRTNHDDIYLIEDVSLDGNRRNLFENFTGNISNIKFVVNYDYSIENNGGEPIYLGVFDKNQGVLTNVGVDVSGSSLLNGSATYYFGGLAGENKGTIQYKNGHEDLNGDLTINDDEIVWESVVAVVGSINLEGHAKVYFGGLAGKNVSSIIGCEKESEGGNNEIVLKGESGRTDSMSLINIKSALFGDSAIGGVVGLNTYETEVGTVKNAYIEAIIDSTNTFNVGGVIGINLQSETSISISNSDYSHISYDYSSLDSLKENSIYNVKSTATINAMENIGGIVGFDVNGIYFDCDYQILNEEKTSAKLRGDKSVGGIAGKSQNGKFIFCSVMNYVWDYETISGFVADVEDIYATNNVGGIVGHAVSSNGTLLVGNNNVNNRVVVISSSVNAFLKCGNYGNVGGILFSYDEAVLSDGYSIIYNSYFVGKLSGNVKFKEVNVSGVGMQYLALDNNGESFTNNVYSLVHTGSEYKYGSLKDSGVINYSELIGVTGGSGVNKYWWWADKVNGGFIYITKEPSQNVGEDHAPIFDLAPKSISANVKVGTSDKVLRLDYYDFSVNESLTEEDLQKFKKDYNIKSSLMDYIEVEAEPSGLGTVVVGVKSTKTTVVDVALDGRLIINGFGECELVFSSVLNPNAGELSGRTIKVVVDYPMGTQFSIRSSQRVLLEDSIEKIAKNSSKQYYISSEGYISKTLPDLTIVKYYYKTKDDLSLKVEVGLSSKGSNFNVGQYISVGGINAEANKNPVEFNLGEQIPFIISVKDFLEGETFSVKVTPYEKIDGVETNYYKVFGSTDPNDIISASFKLSTLVGVTNASFSYDEAVVYPNDTVYFTMILETDLALSVADVQNIINNLASDSNLSFLIKNPDNKVLFTIHLDRLGNHEASTKMQKVFLRIEFNDMHLVNEERFEISAIVSNDDGTSSVLATIVHVVIPQRINKIEIKNYYYNADGTKEQQDVLKPNHFGEITIDIVPNNGYYSYLEISDVTGNEEIQFIQVDSNGNGLSLKYDPSSDGKGIKLYDYGLGKSRLIVRTQISNTYSSKMHTVEVRAYSSNGMLLGSFRTYIDVKMLPEITATMLLPDGGDSALVAQNGHGEADGYLANGVEANFRVETKNANREVEISLGGDLKSNYEFVKDFDNFYVLKPKDNNPDNIGKSITLKFSVKYVMENGMFEIAECEICLKVIEFVIHKVSVNHAIENEISGYLNRELSLEFYFGKYDISFCDTTIQADRPYWETEYFYDPNWEVVYDSSNLKPIYSVLAELNEKTGTNPYLILNNNTRDSGTNEYKQVTNTKISFNSNRLMVESGYKDENAEYLAVAFGMSKDGEWKVSEYNSNLQGYDNYVVDTNYHLNFIEPTTWYEPTVLNSEADFLAMESGGNYILNKDLTLKDYTPLNVNLMQFDGNGHKITIQGFATLNQTDLQVGLFAQVYKEMIVKNVKVEYQSVPDDVKGYTLGYVHPTKFEEIFYTDLSQNSTAKISSVKFGGITAINEGIITNCVVEGKIAISSHMTDTKAEGMEVGAVVSQNTSTGYITNSSSELQIFSLSNIGGFVHSNLGKIVSCSVNGKATISAYNAKLGNTLIVNVAGFAVNNSGEISMSCVDLKKGSRLTENIFEGTLNAKDISAGFIYSNTGNVYDAYVQMTSVGIVNNTFAEFVYNKGGSFERYYTHINNVVTPANDVIDTFAFGDNESAVWKKSVGQMPKLISTSELNFDDFAKLTITKFEEVEDGVNKTKYKVDFANYGTKQNPYIVHDLDTWDNYFNEDLAGKHGYYRIVRDIDFVTVGGNPTTSTMTFSGNIQGNNMNLSNIMLYSTDDLQAIGLFEKMVGANSRVVKNAVRNLKLNVSSVWASSTQMVGVLAGMIENFNIYNITINAENVIMVGSNAVGGVAGVICGEFDIDQISSNISANSTRASILSNYSIYMSKNNKKSSRYNLSDVYYAGSVAGILDAYGKTSYTLLDSRNINFDYYKVNNVEVGGNITHMGDTVGAAFGLVGERVHVNNIKVDISGSILGSEYSAGAVGENRGVIENAQIKIADNVFARSKNVSSGAVGLNWGGLILDVNVEANIEKSDYFQTVAGIVGRNVYGTVTKTHFNGKLFGYYIGGIIGSNYSKEIVESATTGSGALSIDCIRNDYLIPSAELNYDSYTNLEDVSLSIEALNYLVEASTRCYSYKLDEDANVDDLTKITVESRVLGLVVGLCYEDDNFGLNEVVGKTDDRYKINLKTDKIIFNDTTTINGVNFKASEGPVQLYKVNATQWVEFTFTDVNIMDLTSFTNNYVIYLVGARASSFDSWAEYSDEYLLVR